MTAIVYALIGLLVVGVLVGWTIVTMVVDALAAFSEWRAARKGKRQ